jgi:hypothetical protein
MNAFAPRRAVRCAPLIIVGVLAFPGVAFGQATRTWISGVGDDVNPCSRTAPCKTLAGAISKTATGGEIDVIDPIAMGTVTITKSITIDGRGNVSSILGSGTNGININAASSKVTLRNFTINGAGTTNGVNGIRILAAKSVRIVNLDVYGFGIGIADVPSTDKGRLTIENSRFYDNAIAGISIVPTGGASTTARATIRRTSIDDNGDGIVADGTSARVALNLMGVAIGDNNGTAAGTTGVGLHAIANAGIRMGTSEISGNLVGLQADGGATIDSFQDNDVFGNNVQGAPTGTTSKS